mgnify:CR=1 FL=1
MFRLALLVGMVRLKQAVARVDPSDLMPEFQQAASGAARLCPAVVGARVCVNSFRTRLLHTLDRRSLHQSQAEAVTEGRTCNGGRSIGFQTRHVAE